jgi:hypothetical protein
MTLVVAERTPDGIRLVGESRLTAPAASPTLTPRLRGGNRYLEGAMKIVALHPALCVGFAGNVDLAQDAIRQLPVKRKSSFALDQVTHRLVNRSHADGTDFIVASLVPTPSLAKIRDGALAEGGDLYAIGDEAAIDGFASYFYGPDCHRDIGIALRRLIDDEVYESAGDLYVEIKTVDDGFRYAVLGMISHTTRVGPGESVDPEWAGAASGAYFQQTFRPSEPGVGAIGVYFPQGQLGALYYPAKARRAIPYLGVTDPEFRDAVRRDHGIELVGSRIAPGDIPGQVQLE